MGARLRTFGALAAVAVVAPAVACSLVLDAGSLSAGGGAGAADDDADPGAGRDGAGGGDDTATGGDDGGPADAGGDGSLPKAGCDATFCDDFDDGPLGVRWTSVNTTNGGALTLDDAAVSAPFALRMDLPDRDSGVTRRAQLAKTFGAAAHLTCDVRLFVVHPVATGVEGYGLFIVKLSQNGYAIEAKIQDDQTITVSESYKIADAGTNHSVSLGVATPGQWLHLTVTTDFNSLSASLDAIQGTLPLSAAASGALDGGSPLFTVGLGEDSDIDKPAFSARFDDFACSLTP